MAQTTKLNPYLFFGGNCREAMEFYQTVFGGELTISTFGESPADAHQDPAANTEEIKDKIMHAKLNGDVVILASDNPHGTTDDNNDRFSLSLEGTDEDTLTGYFEKLSENGTVTAPLMKQFWGEVFGMVTDQFKVNWMISVNSGTNS
jgi:PhnB protein